jgi:hypothetical protein
MNIDLSKEELFEQFKQQIYFLRTSCDDYDKGITIEGKRIAITLRILFHNSKTSTSLISHIVHPKQTFMSTCCTIKYDPNFQLSQLALISSFLPASTTQFYIPLDKASDKNMHSFEKWWNEIVIIDQAGNEFSRKDIVLSISHKDGGAHVDPVLDDKYYNLSRKNSLGMVVGQNDQWLPIISPELATVRQIGHEVLKTFIKDYQKYPPENNGIIVGNLVSIEYAPVKNLNSNVKIGRNDPCACGSNKKYKKCCGLNKI